MEIYEYTFPNISIDIPINLHVTGDEMTKFHGDGLEIHSQFNGNPMEISL